VGEKTVLHEDQWGFWRGEGKIDNLRTAVSELVTLEFFCSLLRFEVAVCEGENEGKIDSLRKIFSI